MSAPVRPTPPDGRKHHRIRNSVIAAVAVLAALAVVTALWLNSSLGNIRLIPFDLPEEGRPAETKSTTILLLGADSGTERYNEASSILTDAEKKVWPAGKNRSDAIVLVHVDAKTKKVYVISVPRDTFVPIYDGTGEQHGEQKINAALSEYGPAGAVVTMEKFTGARVDHVAITDFDRFENLVDAVGGVYLAEGGGEERLYDGAAALEYARERKTLPNGDFDRVKRQQNFLRAMGARVLEKGVFRNPLELKKTINAITKNLAVDDDWSRGEIRSFAWSLRTLDPDEDVFYLTLPTAGTAEDPVAGSIVVPDPVADKELFDALQHEKMGVWVKAHRDDLLGQFVP